MHIKAVYESNPDVGSSNIITGGSQINSTPIAVLFFSPPDIPFNIRSPTKVSLHCCKFKSFINSFTLFLFSNYDPFNLNDAENSNVS